MKCPHCQGEVPATSTSAFCPACGQHLEPLLWPEKQANKSAPAIGDEPSTLWSAGLMVLKIIGLAIIVIVGGALLLLAIAFAGCMIMGGMK